MSTHGASVTCSLLCMYRRGRCLVKTIDSCRWVYMLDFAVTGWMSRVMTRSTSSCTEWMRSVWRSVLLWRSDWYIYLQNNSIACYCMYLDTTCRLCTYCVLRMYGEAILRSIVVLVAMDWMLHKKNVWACHARRNKHYGRRSQGLGVRIELLSLRSMHVQDVRCSGPFPRHRAQV